MLLVFFVFNYINKFENRNYVFNYMTFYIIKQIRFNWVKLNSLWQEDSYFMYIESLNDYSMNYSS